MREPSGSAGAAGFVLAAKSIARYRRIEDEKEVGDYFLVGTLTSMTLAILAGLAVRRGVGREGSGARV